MVGRRGLFGAGVSVLAAAAAVALGKPPEREVAVELPEARPMGWARVSRDADVLILDGKLDTSHPDFLRSKELLQGATRLPAAVMGFKAGLDTGTRRHRASDLAVFLKEHYHGGMAGGVMAVGSDIKVTEIGRFPWSLGEFGPLRRPGVRLKASPAASPE